MPLLRAPLAVIVSVIIALVAASPGDARSRYDELKRVIDRNTGFAHMTRGMNMYTLIALRSCVTDADIPLLQQMLRDHDDVTQMSAANVLVDMGAPGKKALADELVVTTDTRTRMTIRDALTEVDSPTRKAIQDYPLTDRERRSIRGCGAFRH